MLKTLLFPILLVLVTLWAGADLIRAQAPAPFVHANGAIDKLKRGKSLAGAIMYDFSLYAARRHRMADGRNAATREDGDRAVGEVSHGRGEG